MQQQSTPLIVIIAILLRLRQHPQIRTIIANGILKFKSVIKIPIIYSLVLLLLAASISSRSQFYCNTTFIKHIHQNQKENQTQETVIKIIYHLCVYNF